MKSVKKLSSLAITAVLSAATFAMPVLAAENTTTSSEFSYVKKNEPTYTSQFHLHWHFQKMAQTSTLKQQTSQTSMEKQSL